MAYTINQLKQAVQNAECYSDVCRSLKLTICTFNIKRIKSLCNTHQISTAHFNPKRTFRRGKATRWTHATFIERGNEITRAMLRPTLIRLGHYTHQCAICKISDVWNGTPLTLEVDHINGICEDNRLENLRWLCPNCHSQTPTYRSRTARRSTLTQSE